MEVGVEWEYTDHEEKSIGFTRVLYAYLHPDTNEILYIGKSDYCSVLKRTKGTHKENLFNYFSEELGLDSYACIVGILSVPKGRKYSSELLSDVESLLIISLQPCGNIQSKGTRISRPGLKVTCSGDWPCKAKVFDDK